MGLKDIFSSLKASLVEDEIRVGLVIRFFDNETTPPKIKRHIVVGITSDRIALATVYINSEINFNVINSPDLEVLQLPITPDADHAFIDKDCFIDCSVIAHRSLDEIRQLIIADSSRILGYVVDTERQEISAKLLSAKTISPYYKKLYKL